jgi:hypothetical protein
VSENGHESVGERSECPAPKAHEPEKQPRGEPEPSQYGRTLYNTSPLGSLREANGLIYIRVGGRKLLCSEQFPEPILCVT